MDKQPHSTILAKIKINKTKLKVIKVSKTSPV